VKASTPEFAALLREYNADLFVVAAYGEIVKQLILDLPRLGCINVHASLLPKYRGAAPIQRCLMDGERETGITIIEMVLAMDAGEMLGQTVVPIPPEMNAGELEEALKLAAGPLLLTVIDALQQGNARRIPQEASKVSLAPKLIPEEEKIDWSLSAVQVHDKIRALSPVPGAWCSIRLGNIEKRIKIFSSRVEADQIAPGASQVEGSQTWRVGCGNGSLCLLDVQLEGKRRMDVGTFLRGLQAPLTMTR
jgi:methionyl-tRNA formyltransferase